MVLHGVAIGIWTAWLSTRVASQLITITEYPSSCDVTYTTVSGSASPVSTSVSSSPAPSTSTQPLSDETLNDGEPFVIQIQVGEPGVIKRQASGASYLTAGGYTTTNASEAVQYVIRNGSLTSTKGGWISTDDGIENMPFALSSNSGPINTSFYSKDFQLQWTNTAFDDGEAEFFRVPRDNSSQQIVVRFRGAQGPSWGAVAFIASPTKGVSEEPISGSSMTFSTLGPVGSTSIPETSGGFSASLTPGDLTSGSRGTTTSVAKPTPVSATGFTDISSFSTSGTESSSQMPNELAPSSYVASPASLSFTTSLLTSRFSFVPSSASATLATSMSLFISTLDGTGVIYTQSFTKADPSSSTSQTSSAYFTQGQPNADPIGPNQQSVIISLSSSAAESNPTVVTSSSTPAASSSNISTSWASSRTSSPLDLSATTTLGTSSSAASVTNLETLPSIIYDSITSTSAGLSSIAELSPLSFSTSSESVLSAFNGEALSTTSTAASTKKSQTSPSILSESSAGSATAESFSPSRAPSTGGSPSSSISTTSSVASSSTGTSSSGATESSTVFSSSASSPSSTSSTPLPSSLVSSSSTFSSSASSSSSLSSSMSSSSESPNPTPLEMESTSMSIDSWSSTTDVSASSTSSSVSDSTISAPSITSDVTSTSSTSSSMTSSSAYLILASPTPCNFGDPPSYPEDDSYCRIDLPQSMQMYSRSDTKTFASTNGYISLEVGSVRYEALELPTPELPNSTVAPFFDDLHMQNSSFAPRQGIFYQSNDEGVSYEYCLSRKNAPEEIYHFIVRYEYARAGAFTYTYYAVGNGNNGQFASVGMQGVDTEGSPTGQSFSYKQQNITPGMEITCDTRTNSCTTAL